MCTVEITDTLHCTRALNMQHSQINVMLCTNGEILVLFAQINHLELLLISVALYLRAQALQLLKHPITITVRRKPKTTASNTSWVNG